MSGRRPAARTRAVLSPIMGVRVLRAADRTAVPWKNGGGITREIAAGPDGASMSDFDWRVSLADVAADGPFSAFPGVERILTVVEGAGMALTVGGTPHLVDERNAPRHFPGDEPTQGRLLEGPVVNFNVMYRRDTVSASVNLVTRAALALPAGQLLVVALDGTADLTPDQSAAAPDAAVRLGRHDAALLTRGGGLRTDGTAAVVRLGRPSG